MVKIISKSKEFLLLAILLNAGALVLFGFLFVQIKAANERTSGLLNEIELESKEESTLKSIKALVQETEPLRGQLDTYFVPRDGVAEFISLLESAGRKGGVTVTIEQVGEEEIPDSTELLKLNVTLNATGSFADVIRFLGILEFLPYEATINQLMMSRSSEGWRIDTSVSVLKIR